MTGAGVSALAGGALTAMPTLGGGAQLDHLGIAVPDLAAATAFYTRLLGLVPERLQPLPEQGISVAMFQLQGLRIELLAPIGAVSPITDVLEDHTIQAFLARQPAGGLHHVCYRVDDLDAASPPGVRYLGRGQPIVGAQGRPIVFLDPATTGGALIELKLSG